jgi:hypothetical protein
VARWEREHEGWRAGPGLEGTGYGARRIDERGIPHGPVVGARTLDELHEVLAGAGRRPRLHQPHGQCDREGDGGQLAAALARVAELENRLIMLGHPAD